MLFSRKPFPLAHKECELVPPQVICPFLVPVWDALGESDGGGKRFASAKRDFLERQLFCMVIVRF
jgi:hypothetical protein